MDDNRLLSYQEQLETPMWNSCRERILKRDNNRCRFCGKGHSVIVSFEDSIFHLGIDFSKSEIDCSEANILVKGKIRDILTPLKGLKLKKGTIPGSDNFFLLFSNGLILYTPWHKNINCEINPNTTSVAKIISQDGYIANVLFNNKEELNDLNLYRVYIRKSPLVLQVHHKHYMMDKRAWEYEDEDLVTLCQDCHSMLHHLIPVKAYAMVNGQKIVMNYTPCHRCQGTGYFPEYRKVQNGICFRCGGARFEELISPKIEEVNLEG